MGMFDQMKQAMQMRKEAMEAYQSQCGPLMADQTRSDSRFLWVEGPWPWEGGMQ